MATDGLTGGLALFALIMFTTIVVFGIKFILDRKASTEEPEKKQEPTEQKKPFYIIKSSSRKKRSKAEFKALPKDTLFTLEPVGENKKDPS